jgi:hypothetical protein
MGRVTSPTLRKSRSSRSERSIFSFDDFSRVFIHLGRKQPVPILALSVALPQLPGHGRSGSQLFCYPCGSVAAIQRKMVAAISKIRWANPGTATPCVASISENHTRSKRRERSASENERSCKQSMTPPMRSSHELFKAPALALPENCTPA